MVLRCAEPRSKGVDSMRHAMEKHANEEKQKAKTGKGLAQTGRVRQGMRNVECRTDLNG